MTSNVTPSLWEAMVPESIFTDELLVRPIPQLPLLWKSALPVWEALGPWRPLPAPAVGKLIWGSHGAPLSVCLVGVGLLDQPQSPS